MLTNAQQNQNVACSLFVKLEDTVNSCRMWEQSCNSAKSINFSPLWSSCEPRVWAIYELSLLVFFLYKFAFFELSTFPHIKNQH